MDVIPIMTIAEIENIIIGHLMDFVVRGGRVPQNLIEEALAMGVILPDVLLVDRQCVSICKNGQRCKNSKKNGNDTCLVHVENPPPRIGDACAIQGCKSFVGKWAPHCYSHAKKQGLIPEPQQTVECAICYVTMYDTNEKILGCKHAFHKKCISHWFGTQQTQGVARSCPMCRQEMA
jgi:hypothetical protein